MPGHRLDCPRFCTDNPNNGGAWQFPSRLFGLEGIRGLLAHLFGTSSPPGSALRGLFDLKN